jgi:hypothetical protein
MSNNKTHLPVATSYKLAAMSDEFVPPKGKTYNKPEHCFGMFRQLRFRLDKLQLVGKPLSNPDLLSLIRVAQEVTECEASIARTMLQPFRECLMDRKTVDLVCWQIAGNRKRLLDQEVHIYNGRKEEAGWMSAIIAEHLHDEKSPRGSYRVRVLDGPAAGFDLYMPVPKYLRRISDVIGGTYKVDKERIRLDSPKEAVQFRVMVYPEQVKVSGFDSHSGHISFKVLRDTDSIGVIKAGAKQKKHNLELAKSRRKKCLKDYKNPCHVCQVGYDDCPRGCKPRSVAELPNTVEILIKGKNLCQKISEEA